jgi:hypothetical protein
MIRGIKSVQLAECFSSVLGICFVELIKQENSNWKKLVSFIAVCKFLLVQRLFLASITER